MRIDIVIHADVLCPWSFLEKRSIETAIYRYKTRNPGIEFEVVWKPYLLYPTLRRADKRELYCKIMGPEKLRTFIDDVQTAGTRHGINFAVHGSTGASQSCHRLIALTLRTMGPVAQAAVVESIYRGHFENGLDVTDDSWLLSVGRSVGLEPQAVMNALECQTLGRALEDEVRAATAGGVIAVPSVLIGGRYRVAGYQEPSLFEGVFDRLREEREQGLMPSTNDDAGFPRLDREVLGQSREGSGPDRQGSRQDISQGPGLNRGGPEPVRQGPGPDRDVWGLSRESPKLGRQVP